MKHTTLILFLLVGTFLRLPAFCGFYVAQADATLFNRASEVILVRDGKQTVITMSSDFEGDVKDFAMIIPVPEVLSRDNIRIADRSIFDRLDAYSAPRLVEYHDQNPCAIQRYEMSMGMLKDAVTSMDSEEDFAFTPPDLGVTIVEKYTVGEYDILILSAEESDGLETWLTMNGYKIPVGASEVLEPYIKSDMKFFVVKVNMEEFETAGFQTLRPIQVTFRSDKFMLPIRLGMANANGDQDLIVYAFTKNGRIETANYRNVEIPTDRNIPEFVQAKYGDFYSAVFDRMYKKSDKKAVFTEYAWDLSSTNFVKCDPCPTTPPAYSDLRESGVFWATQGGTQNWGGADYTGDVFMTRMHVRYNRKTFPQDLMFMATPNKQSFQGRYIITHPAQGDLTCEQAQPYLKSLVNRRQKELEELTVLTGWSTWLERDTYVGPYRKMLSRVEHPFIEALPGGDVDDGFIPGFLGNINHPGPGWPLMILAMGLGLLGILGVAIRLAYLRD